MANLPFVIQPKREPRVIRVGTSESGVIEITQYGYLRTVEKALYQTAKPTQLGTVAAQKLAQELMAKHKVTADQSATIMGLNKGKMTPKMAKIQDEHGEEILKVLQQINADVEQLAVLQATILLQQRVNPDWGAMDTAELHPELIVDLSNLFVEEEQRSMRSLQDETPESDEVVAEEGKPQGQE
jgi:hypothetical protein